MTEMIQCPQCRNTFVVPPGQCPDCGAEVRSPTGGTAGQDTVVQYRLNRLASAGGITLAAFLSGSVTWFLGRQAFGVGIFLVGLMVAAILLVKE